MSQSDVDVAASAYDQAQAELALAQASIRQAQAALEEARINLGYTDIVSPVDGIVVSRNVDVGQTVAASFQTPTLFEIAQDLTRMQVKRQRERVGHRRACGRGRRRSSRSTPTPAGASGAGSCRCGTRRSTIQNVVTYDVIVEVDNSDLALKPGMTATLAVLIDRAGTTRCACRCARCASGRRATAPRPRRRRATPPGPRCPPSS